MTFNMMSDDDYEFPVDDDDVDSADHSDAKSIPVKKAAEATPPKPDRVSNEGDSDLDFEDFDFGEKQSIPSVG